MFEIVDSGLYSIGTEEEWSIRRFCLYEFESIAPMRGFTSWIKGRGVIVIPEGLYA